MIIASDSIVLLSQLTSIVKLPDFGELTMGVDYSILPNTPINASIVSKTEIELDSEIDAKQGDDIILNIGGFEFKNIIDNIDDTKKKILLVDYIKDKNGAILETGNCTIKINANFIVKLNNLDEGLYLIKPTNQKMIVRRSWIQPFVTFGDLSAKLIDTGNLTQSRLTRLNKVALKFIYSDLSNLDNYYDIIDDIDLWKLLYLKIECLLSTDYENQESTSCNEYKSELKKYSPSEKLEQGVDGKPTENIEEFTIGRWSL